MTVFKKLINYLFLPAISFNILFASAQVKVGAENTKAYLPLLKGKNVALIVNQTSMTGSKHLVDQLLELEIKVKKIFVPEHGFRGDADAGEAINNSYDKKTGLPIISLYGNHKKPSAEDIKGIDIMVFDIQDVGARFYTYISTMHYVMEACAEHDIDFLVLDRPNPNGFYIDGPVLDTKFTSFVGMHPVPIVHGMTIAEYAKMINGEFWLKDSLQCNLHIVACEGYDHNTYYTLPINPSPNLKTITAIYLYPSLCLFEGTVISVGRGTDKPFQVIGHPDFQAGYYYFKPKSMAGAKHPLYEDKTCNGFNLSNFNIKNKEFITTGAKINLQWLINMYQQFPDKGKFFNDYFDKLAGTDILRNLIIKGWPDYDIRKTWEKGIEEFKEIRKKYLLYQDFE